MASKLRILNLSIPENFVPIKQEADKLVEEDPRFKESLSHVQDRYNKKNKQNKFDSIKMRFYIGFYLMTRKRELMEEQTHVEKSKN